MKKLLVTFLFVTTLTAQLLGQSNEKESSVQVLKTPNSEVEDAIKFLSEIPEIDRQFIRFFSTYAIQDPQDREEVVLQLSFVIHTLVGPSENDELSAGAFYPLALRDEDGNIKYYRRVTDTLHWVDLREYNWTIKAWEEAAKLDGYFAEPIVQHDKSGALRLLSGNAVLRADWFINEATNVVNQTDVDERPLHDALLYASVKIPTTLTEWREIWGIDPDKSQQLGNEAYSMTTKSRAVARHNRVLLYRRTELGYAFETYDVKHQRGLRDYLESFFLNKRVGAEPNVSDAGEAFTTNQLGLQTGYVLFNRENDKIVPFADPTVARHREDILTDVRVRASQSCMDCHASGPIMPENTIREFVSKGGDLLTRKKSDQLRIRKNYLSGKFEAGVDDGQTIFARSLLKVNGLEPTTNGSMFLKVVQNYNKPLNIEQAAFECGVTIEEFTDKITDKAFGGRLKLLIIAEESIPRDIWEHKGQDGIPGLFQQAMICINGLTVIDNAPVQPTQQVITQSLSNKPPSEAGKKKVYQALRITQVYVGEEIVDEISPGELLQHSTISNNGWVYIKTQGGNKGWVNSHHVREMEITLEEWNGVFADN